MTELLCSWLNLPETYRNPFFVGWRFFDFDSFQQRFQHLHTLAFFDFNQPFSYSYPPPAASIYAAFYSLGPVASLNCWLAVFCISVLAVTALFVRALYRRGLILRDALFFGAGTLALAFPVWFCFQRANLEIFVFLSLAAGLFAFASGRGYAAAACFGIAVSLKLVPFVYLALFLARRQYRQAVFGFVVAAAATLLGLWFIGPSIPIAWKGCNDGLVTFQRDFLLQTNPNSVGFDHTFIGMYRRCFQMGPAFALMIRRYTACAATLGVLLYIFRIRRMPLLSQLLCLSTAAVLFPPISFEYTLMHLYLAFGFLCLTCLPTRPPGTGERLTPFFVLLALLVSPLSEFIWLGQRFGGQIKCVLLLALFVLALLRPLHATPGPGERLEAVPEQ